MDTTVNYAIEDFTQYDNDESAEFAYCTIDVLSTAPNSHKHKYTEEILRRDMDSVLGKWVVAGYDNFTKDATTHVGDDMKIVGIVPKAQEVKYREENGVVIASVDAVISKLYAVDIYNVFKDKTKTKAVSIEAMVNFTEDTKNYVDGEKEKVIDGFDICAITILGSRYRGSCPNASITMVKMSDDEINTMENEYIKYSNKCSNVESMNEKILAKLEEINNKLDKEETMSEIKEETVVENAEITVEEMSETPTEEEQNNEAEHKDETEAEGYAEGKEEPKAEEPKEETEDAENDKAEDVDKEACDDKVAEMAELKAELDEANQKIAQYETLIAELKTFKENTEMAQKDAIVTDTLAKAEAYCDKDEYKTFKDSAEMCEFANIGAWKNEVLANISERVMAKMSNLEVNNENGVLEMGMPIETKTKTDGLWDSTSDNLWD